MVLIKARVYVSILWFLGIDSWRQKAYAVTITSKHCKAAVLVQVASAFHYINIGNCLSHTHTHTHTLTHSYFLTRKMAKKKHVVKEEEAHDSNRKEACRADFPPHFVFGVSTSSYQVFFYYAFISVKYYIKIIILYPFLSYSRSSAAQLSLSSLFPIFSLPTSIFSNKIQRYRDSLSLGWSVFSANYYSLFWNSTFFLLLEKYPC